MEDLNHLPPPQPQKPFGQSKSLAIALVVSAVFLLAAAVISYLLLTKPAGAPTSQKTTGDGSEKVKNVAWETPATIPASFARRDQNIQNVATTYYIDAAMGCSITTTVQPAQASATVKQGVLDTAKAAQAYGIAVTASKDIPEVKIQNQNGASFAFEGLQLEQSVAIAGIAYASQRTNIAFKQFGQQVATIAYSCRTDAWDAKNSELQTYVSAFKVKTE